MFPTTPDKFGKLAIQVIWSEVMLRNRLPGATISTLAGDEYDVTIPMAMMYNWAPRAAKQIFRWFVEWEILGEAPKTSAATPDTVFSGMFKITRLMLKSIFYSNSFSFSVSLKAIFSSDLNQEKNYKKAFSRVQKKQHLTDVIHFSITSLAKGKNNSFSKQLPLLELSVSNEMC